MLRITRVSSMHRLRFVRNYSSATSHDNDSSVSKENRAPSLSKSSAARRLGGLAWTEKGPLISGVALSSMVAGLQLLFPKALGVLLDRSVDLNRSSGSSAAVTEAASTTTDFSSSKTDQTATYSRPDSTKSIESPVSDTGSSTTVHEELPTSVIDSSDNGAWEIPPEMWSVDTIPPEYIGGALFTAAFVQAGLLMLRSKLLTGAGEAIAARVREKALGNLMKQEMAFFDKEDTAELVTRLSTDTAKLQSALTSSLVGAARGSTMSLGAITMLVSTSPSLAALSLASFPPVFLFAAWKGRHMKKEQAKVQESLGLANGVATQAIGYLRGLRGLGQDQALLPKFADAVATGKQRAEEVARSQATLDAAVQVAGNAVLLGVLTFGSSEVAAGHLSPGDLSAFMLYSLFLGFQTAGLSTTYADVQRAIGASERVLSLSDRVPTMVPPSKEVAAVSAAILANQTMLLQGSLNVKGATASSEEEAISTEPMTASPSAGLSLAFQNCAFTYPARPEAGPVLEGLSLEIGAGEVVGLQGESGCGKSTLSRLALRLYDVDRVDHGTSSGSSGDDSSSGGGVMVGGVNVRDIGFSQLRGGLIGVVAQDPFLLQGSIADNIRVGAVPLRGEKDATNLRGTHDGNNDKKAVLAAAKAAGLGPLLARLPLGLNTPVGEGGATLSGGERQRVALARAWMRQPPVLILDEFTSALDDSTEEQVIANLRPWLRGRTVLCIAHHSRVFARLGATRVVTLGARGAVLSDQRLQPGETPEKWNSSQFRRELP